MNIFKEVIETLKNGSLRVLKLFSIFQIGFSKNYDYIYIYILFIGQEPMIGVWNKYDFYMI